MQSSTYSQSTHQVQYALLLFKKVLNIKTPVQKLLGFCPMLNDTFVILAILGDCREGVRHIDHKGNILKQIVFHQVDFNSYIIPSRNQIIWSDHLHNLLRQWNLQTYQLLQYNHLFLDDHSIIHQLHYFSETSLICIVERKEDFNNIRITYYKYPLNQYSEKIYSFQSQEISQEYVIKKGNQTSMIVIYKAEQDNNISFQVFSLTQANGQFVGQLRDFKVIKPFSYGFQKKVYHSIGSIWQMVTGKFMIISVIPHPFSFTPNICLFQKVFIIQQKQNLIISRELKFQHYRKPGQRLVDYFRLGNVTVLRTFYLKNELDEQSSIYYIHNETEKLLAVSVWKCNYLNKYTFPGYDCNLLIDAQYENADVRTIVSNQYEIFEYRLLTANILCQFIPQINQNLLFQVIELLYQQK